VQRACIGAWYLVGIIPVRNPEVRQRRTSLSVDMDLMSLLSTYFDSKPEHKPHKKALLEKARLVEAELSTTYYEDTLT
jgi:hypothetical protein